MEIIEARECGFCFGVDRAINICIDRIDKGERVYTYGEIIHNETVLRELALKGVAVIEGEDDIERHERGTVVIRAHGVTPQIYEKIDSFGHNVVDATCPFVKKIHNFVSEYSGKGFHIIVTGKKDHPEVKGICGYSKGGRIDVVEDVDDIENICIDGDEEVLILSQTTFNQNKFKDLVEIIGEKSYHDRVRILNTICNVTDEQAFIRG